MNFSLLLVVFVLAFAGFVSSDNSIFTYHTTSTLEPNQTAGFPLSASLGFPIPSIPKGLFNITVDTEYTFELCLQEGVEVLGDVYSCNPGGFFNFTRSNDSSNAKTVYTFEVNEMSSIFGNDFGTNFLGDSAQTTTASTTIRAGVEYYLSYRFADGDSPANASYSLEIAFLKAGCNPGFVGLADGSCRGTLPLSNATKVSGSTVAQNSTYFSFEVTSKENQLFEVTLTLADNTSTNALAIAAASPAVTVSVRRGAAPSNTTNDGSASLNGTQVTVSVPTPAAGSYFVQVDNQGEQAVLYNLNVVAKGCESGFGPDCKSTVTDLTHNDTVILVTGSGGYDYYLVRNSTLTVGVGTKKLDETAPVLLSSIYNYPDNSTALTTSGGNLVNYAYLHSPTENTTFYLSVWAEDGVDYYIWANNFCANNCAGSGSGVNASSNSTLHGQCNVYTGVCDCDSGYSGLFCDRSRLATVWIVLLIIGPAIILAIAIGIPVACFLRNRRRARYERV